MNTSYKRYWEPSTGQALVSSVGVGLVATALLQPIEFVKTRIQTRADGIGCRGKSIYSGYNPHRIFREIHSNGQGLTQFYKGLDAALLARGSYLLIRNLVYKVIYDRVKPVKPTNDLTNREKAVLAGFAGGLAAFLSNPFELVMVREIYDGSLKSGQRRNYKGAFDALSRIVAEEGGNAALFKGAGATVLRSVLLNMSLTIPYDWLNESMWISFGDISVNKSFSLVFAALVGSLVTLPFDNIKTRLQKQFPDPNLNRVTYKGILDTINKVVVNEGYTGFLAGFYAYYARVTLYGFLTVYTMDYLTTRWKKGAGLSAELI